MLVAFVAGYVGYAIHGGLGAVAALRALAVIVVLQIVPGLIVWRAVRPRKGSWSEDIAFGFAIGSVLALGVQIPAGLLQAPWLSSVALIAVGVALLAAPASRRRVLSRATSAQPWWWLPSVALTTLVMVPGLRDYFREVPLVWESGARSPHVDAPLHLALSGQLGTRGPTKFPWVESEPLAYHWFSHSWVAQVARASGTELDGVLFRLMPSLMPLAVALAVAVAAVRLSGRQWAGPVAAALALAGGDLNVFGRFTPGFPIAPLSPSLALGAPMLVVIVVILALRWQGDMRAGSAALLAVVSLGAAGTKGSTLPLVAAGLFTALVAALILNRPMVRRVLVDLGIVLASLVTAVVLVFRGSGAGLHVDLAGAADASAAASWLGGVQSVEARAFVLVLAVAAVLSRAVGAVVLVGDRTARRQMVTWLLIGASLAGAGAVGVFAHPGSSQYYFARSAAPLMALASTLGLVVLADRLGVAMRRPLLIGAIAGVGIAVLPFAVMGALTFGEPRHALGMLIVAGLVLAVAVALVSDGPDVGHRRLGVVVVAVLSAGVVMVSKGVVESDPLPPAQEVSVNNQLAISRDQIDAARWIRANSDVDDLVMTNRHCVRPTPPVDCDNRRWSVAAYTERQILVEGWTPAPRATEIAPDGRDSITVDYWYPELLELNDGFIEAPTTAAADDLIDRGVRWVFVDHTRPSADTLEPYAVLRFENEGVRVYELGASM